MALVGILTSVDGLKGYLAQSFSSMGAGTFKIRNMSLGFSLDEDEDSLEENAHLIIKINLISLNIHKSF